MNKKRKSSVKRKPPEENPLGPPSGGSKGETVPVMLVGVQNNPEENLAVEKNTIRAAKAHLTLQDRIRLSKKWNPAVKDCRQDLSIRSFARQNGISNKTWERELTRGCTGPYAVVDTERVRHDNKFAKKRWVYAEYDPNKAQQVADDLARNKGPSQKILASDAKRFSQLVLEEGRSPFHAQQVLVQENPGRHIPCVRTFYYHIDAGDMAVKRGDTPYHPGHKKVKREGAHDSKVVPGRKKISERPAAANDRSEKGHMETDTIVSCKDGKGGLLVVVDRKTRLYHIELLKEITQDAVIKGFKRMKHKGKLRGIASVTTDNGTEFLDPSKLEKELGCDIYYTQACASYEKGTIENTNRLVRRWYPKGTDFSKVKKKDIQILEKWINSTRRKILGGKSAYDADALPDPVPQKQQTDRNSGNGDTTVA